LGHSLPLLHDAELMIFLKAAIAVAIIVVEVIIMVAAMIETDLTRS